MSGIVSSTWTRGRCIQSTGVAQTISLRGELFVSRQMARLGLAGDPVEESRIEERAHNLHRAMNTV